MDMHIPGTLNPRRKQRRRQRQRQRRRRRRQKPQLQLQPQPHSVAILAQALRYCPGHFRAWVLHCHDCSCQQLHCQGGKVFVLLDPECRCPHGSWATACGSVADDREIALPACAGAPEPSLSPSTTGSPCLRVRLRASLLCGSCPSFCRNSICRARCLQR